MKHAADDSGVARRVLTAFLLAGGFGCAHVAPEANLKPLRDVVRSEMAARGAMPWSGARPLAWTDFRGAPQTGGQESARTDYTLFYAVRCRGSEFEDRVVAGFLPKTSWVKPAVLSDAALSRRTLRHEQTHFDLTEAYARKLRKSYSELTNPCARSNEELEAIAQGVVREEQAVQRRYDTETRNGLVSAEQARWEKEVAALLASLRKYIQLAP